MTTNDQLTERLARIEERTAVLPDMDEKLDAALVQVARHDERLRALTGLVRAVERRKAVSLSLGGAPGGLATALLETARLRLHGWHGGMAVSPADILAAVPATVGVLALLAAAAFALGLGCGQVLERWRHGQRGRALAERRRTRHGRCYGPERYPHEPHQHHLQRTADLWRGVGNDRVEQADRVTELTGVVGDVREPADAGEERHPESEGCTVVVGLPLGRSSILQQGDAVRVTTPVWR